MGDHADAAAECIHRRRRRRQGAQQIEERLWQLSRRRHALLKRTQLRPIGQLVVEKQKGDFIKARLLGQFRHGVAAVAKPFCYGGKGRLARDDPFKTR